MRSFLFKKLSAAFMLLLFAHIGFAQLDDAPAAVYPLPSAEKLRWHEMELNAFVHFTINTFTDKEWGYGNEDAALFNPTSLDADQWIKTLKEAGFKGVILTAKHHDGFCLWPTAYTSHSITSSLYKNGQGDLVKEVSDACKKHGLKFGIYLSPWDRNRADYGQPGYIEYYRNQLEELFTAYGPIFEMWFDGANGGDGYYGGANEKRPIDGRTYYDWPKTLDLVRKMEPEVIFFSDAGPGVRWVGNESGEVSKTNWNTINPDTLYPGKANIERLLGTGSPDGTAWIPAECDVSIRPGWFYHEKEDSLVKSAEKLFDLYLTSVGRGSNLLLNIAPDKRGLIPDKDIAVLKQWKAMRDKAFSKNFALSSKLTTSAIRNNDKNFSGSKCIDADKETYWTTNDDVKSGWVEIEFETSKKPNYLVLQEYIKLGQRVKAFTVEVWKDNKWQTIATETTIGYKRILKLESPETKKVRVSIVDSKACPLISNIEIY